MRPDGRITERRRVAPTRDDPGYPLRRSSRGLPQPRKDAAMRTFVVLLCAACALSASPQRADPWRNANQDAAIYPLTKDLDSCASWGASRKREDDSLNSNVQARIDSAFSRTWLWGFVSGASAYGRRPLADVTIGAIDAWTDKYCADHPLDRLSTAGLKLVEELAARKAAGR